MFDKIIDEFKFVTYQNKFNPHINIHLSNCNQIAKNGGIHQNPKSGEYCAFSTIEAALFYSEAIAKAMGLEMKKCSFCKP